jgi:histone-lysine N-methyltransferase SETMAR
MLTVLGLTRATNGMLSRDWYTSEQCSLQCDILKPTIRRKGRGLLLDSVVLFHDNTCPHTAANAVETLKKLNFEVLEHPLYSPDLAPSDYQLFGPSKQVLNIKHKKKS